MKDETEKIPPFIQDYLNKMEYEGYADFVKLSRDFNKEREDYPGRYATQSAHLKDFNIRTGKNHHLDYEDGLKRIDVNFKKKAYDTAIKHGFKGPDPNKPNDKEFTKQGEKFQVMIDKSKQQVHQHMKLPEQKQETSRTLDDNNIDKIKEQKPYQQNQPNIEFNEVKEKPINKEQESLEQQRAAFLEKIKKTRDDITREGPTI